MVQLLLELYCAQHACIGGIVQDRSSIFIDRSELARQFRAYFPYFFLLACICSIDRLLLGKFAAVDIYDSIEVHFVHYKTIANLLREFGLFGWYPGIGGGQPVFVSQHPPYALPSLLSMFLPIWSVNLIWILCLQMAAGWGTYRMLREIVRVSDAVSLFVACLFMSTIMFGIVHLVFCFAFPLFCVWHRDLYDSHLKLWRRLFVLVGMLCITLTAFPVLTLPHFAVLHFAIILTFQFRRKGWLAELFRVVMIWTGFIMIFSPLIVSLFLYIPYAQRFWHPQDIAATHALLDFLASFRGRANSIPLISIVVISAFYAFRIRALRTPLLFIIIPLIVSAAFGSEIRHLFADTFFSKMDLFLSATVLPISSIIVVSIFIQHLMGEQRRIHWLLYCTGLVFCLTLGSEHRILRHLLIFSSLPLFLSLMGTKTHRARNALWLLPVILATIIMTSRQENVAAGMYVPFAKGFDSHPSLMRLYNESRTDPFRVACIDLHPAIAQSEGLETVGLKFPVYNRYYKQYVGTALRFNTIKDEAKYYDVWRQLYITRRKGDEDQHPLALETGFQHSLKEFNLPSLRAMNVRYLLSSKPILDIEHDAELLEIDPGLQLEGTAFKSLAQHYSLPILVYRLAGALPRTFAAKSVTVQDSAQKVLASLQTNTDPYAVVLSDDAATKALTPLRPSIAEPKVSKYTPDNVVITGASDGNGLVVLSNNWDAGWTATVNGSPAKILRVNHSFMAVAVGDGSYRVDFKYNNPLLWRMHLATFAGLLLFCLNLIPSKESAVGIRLRDEPVVTHIAITSEYNLFPLIMAQSITMPVLWGIGYYMFEVVKRTNANSSWYGYVLVTTMVIGVLATIWGRIFFRKLLRAGRSA